ncbi:MAG: GNAT family N-acetyltransferase [bacterium]|nr:GNAT family N-acetyltransferase [bacterium]
MEIRLLKKRDWPIIESFNKEQYRHGHILVNKEYYDWQFDNIFNTSKENYTSLGLFNKDRELVGTVGLFLADCNFFGKSIKCNWIANLIVKENLRSLGYGVLLLKEAEKGFDLLVDHNVNALAQPLFEKMGYKVGNVKRYVCILNSGAMEVLTDQKNLNFKVYENHHASNPLSLKFKVVTRCGKEFDSFWAEIKSKYPISIDRSSQYLNWRYADNPLVKYDILTISEGDKMMGFVVLRIEEVTSGIEKKTTGIKIGRIVDMVVNKEVESQLLLKTVEFCRGKNLDLVDFFFTGNFLLSTLEEAGFASSDIQPYSFIPTLLNPINRTKRTKNNFAFKLINQNYFNKDIGNLDNWYTTKGCGDQDRPY